MTLTKRVLAGSLGTVAVFAVLVVTLADRRLERRLVRDAVQELSREARLAAAQWRVGVDADSLADDVGRHLEHRVTLIDSTGRVIGDSEFDSSALGRLENHLSRPEVMDARRSGRGWSLRRSASAGDEELYVAVPAALGYARISMRTGAVSAIVGGAQRDVLIGAALAVTIAVALTLLFARSVSRPIVELRDVARGLAAGDLSRRPQRAAAGEVGDLADAISRMAEQLAARLSALEADDALVSAMLESLDEGVLAVDASGRVVRVNSSARHLLGVTDAPPFATTQLPRDRAFRQAIDHALDGQVTEPVERVVAGRTLTITARPLRGGGAIVALLDLTPFRRLDAVRRDFVANVSHELRTPLTVINGFAETLADDRALDGDQRRFVELIGSNAKRMQAIVDDLLDLSRIESGGWKPAPERVDVAAIARDVVSALSAQVAAAGVDVRIETASAPTMHADAMALRQVLSNLVNNALRHSQRGSVTIFTATVPGGVRIGVRDTGTGIPAEHLPRIFERFYRVDHGRARDQGGTGLGLSIVRHLVEAHGGFVEAQSSVGNGTTVTAFFPV